jgi:3''-phosphoadenosine 5''-phosphosulfate sulfotransferase (PAPS reductase)/FAD synthetase and related enzymes
MFMSYKRLEVEQRKDLDYKIIIAVNEIERALSVCKHRPAIAFSGGKDSTVLWHIIRIFFPEWEDKFVIIYGNTGVEYPECLQFARKLGKEWGNGNFYETRPAKTECEGLKYEAQVQVLKYITEAGRLGEILKDDGKLKSTEILYNLCPPVMLEQFRRDKLVWPKGTMKTYWWCVDQYGWPIFGKAFSKLKAHRINIECFLKYSQTESEDKTLIKYYELLKQVKISQMCCDVLKKNRQKITKGA